MKITTSVAKIHQQGRLLISTLLLVAALLGLFAFSIKLSTWQDYVDSDFFSFWLAGHMVVNGQNPYAEEAWVEGHRQQAADWISDPTFLYPLPLAILFSAIGLLPLLQGYIVWQFLSQVLILVSVALLLSIWKGDQLKHYVLPVLAGVLLFRPVIITIQYGQVGALWLFLLSLVVYFWEKGHWTWGGIFLPLVALKPSYGLIIVGLASIWLILRKERKAIKGEIGSMAGLLLASLVLNPDWIGEYQGVGARKISQTFGRSPTVWGISYLNCDLRMDCTILLSVLLILIFLGLTGYVLIKHGNMLSPAQMFSLVIPTALLITPYLWAYDQIILLVPILIIMLRLRDGGHPYIFSASFLLLVDMLALAAVYIALKTRVDAWSTVVPAFVLMFVIWSRFYLITDRSPLYKKS